MILSLRGISPIVVLSHNLNPMSFEFCGGDIVDAQSSSAANPAISNMTKSFVDNGLAAHQVRFISGNAQ